SFEDEVTWSIPLLVPAGTEPGKKTLRCQAGYQICDAQTCKFPGRWTLPEVALTVLPGVATASEAATSALAAAPPPPPAPASAPPPPVNVTVVEKATSREVVSEVARQADLGLIPFLIFSAIGGLGALVMPCVWPMVPITVNFFVKQGQGKHKGRATGLAV